jgi:hypothetical protein
MSGIFGDLDINSTEYGFVKTIGQAVVWDLVQKYLARANEEQSLVLKTFVGETTEGFKERYKLPGGGMLQKITEKGTPAAVQAYGSYDVAYPLEEMAAKIVINRVDMGYMSAVELQNHIDTIIHQDWNALRTAILHRLLDNVQEPFVDVRHGSLLIEPLANNDDVLYPPIIGSADDAKENHYLESAYLAADISDTNNPLVTMRDELEEHFGVSTGGTNTVVFCNNAQRTQLSDLTDFDSVPDNYIRVGTNTDVPVGLPNVPGVILGRASGVWVVEWRWMPANYLLGINLDETAPLVMRVDPASTGLGQGLTLVATYEQHPFTETTWSHRYGLGCGNRLNGVVMELGTGGTYTVPAAYT